MVLVDKILAVVEKGLIAYQTHLATRQEAYERKMDKSLRRALAYAGTAFRRLNELDIEVEDKDYLKAKSKFYKYRGKV